MHRSIAELICQSQTFVVKWNESAYILLAYICLTLSYVILLFANYSRLHKTKMFGHVFGLPPIYRCGLGQFLQQYLLQKFEGQRFENLKLPSAGFITACMYLSMLFFQMRQTKNVVANGNTFGRVLVLISSTRRSSCSVLFLLLCIFLLIKVESCKHKMRDQ